MATNYNHIAYSKSADGSDRFSNGYPVLNLVSGTNNIKEVSGVNSNPTDIYYSLYCITSKENNLGSLD